MKYISTRAGTPATNFSNIVLSGLCDDGGLAIPETFPSISATQLKAWENLPYDELAFEVCQLFIDDIKADDLKALLKEAYQHRFTHLQPGFSNQQPTLLKHDVCSLRALNEQNDLFMLGLSHGPTLAFKDIAMQWLGTLFEHLLKVRQTSVNIVGATSGDTGSAAEEAMRGKENINVFMLSPNNRMSAFQQAQMFSITDKNICNISVNGVFDDCQDLVKAINQDQAFKQQFNIGAVNSINWARILAQTVYYFYAYLFYQRTGGDKKVSFCVPSGNFGNAFAGFVAKKIGLPIHRIIVATNENDVLDQFFKTGVYHIRPASKVDKTSSPSMDIGKASNFERYIHCLLKGDGERVKALWQSLSTTNTLDLSDQLDAIKATGIISGKSTHANRLNTIRELLKERHDLIDPHTADGVFVAKNVQKDDECIFCLETALATKFADTIEEATGQKTIYPSAFVGIESLPTKREVIDIDIDALKHIIQQH